MRSLGVVCITSAFLLATASATSLRNMTLGNDRPPCANRVRHGDMVRARYTLAVRVGDRGEREDDNLRKSHTFDDVWRYRSREATDLRDVLGFGHFEEDWKEVHSSDAAESFTAVGTEEGSSEDLYDGTVIRGVAMGIVGMCAGETRVVFVPPSLAFGTMPIDDVPGNRPVMANITLLSSRTPSNAARLSPTERFLRQREDYQAWQGQRLREVRLISEDEKRDIELHKLKPSIAGFNPFKVRSGREVKIGFLARSVTTGDWVMLARRGKTCQEAALGGETQPVRIEDRSVTVTLPRGIFYACFKGSNAPEDWHHIWTPFPTAIVKSY